MSGFITDHIKECCVCGASIDTREEMEGGSPDGCQMANGAWVCDTHCYDEAARYLAQGTPKSGTPDQQT